MRAPPSTALLELSGAIIPSGVPEPNFPGSFDAFFAWSYARMLATEPPAPGKIPVNTPIVADRTTTSQRLEISLNAPKWSIRAFTVPCSDSDLIALSGSRTSLNNCEKANRPISTAIKSKPDKRASDPKSKRAMPAASSSPTVRTRRPKAPAIRPLTKCLPARLAVMVSANITNMKKSQGWNSRPTRANCGARVIKQMAEKMPPKKDDHTPKPNARPGLPPRAMGKPSNVVATEDGVPGMPVRIPAINPPDSPPTMTLTMVATPCSGGMEKVNGKVRTTAMAMVKPGMAPAINPPATPTAMSSMVFQIHSPLRAAEK